MAKLVDPIGLKDDDANGDIEFDDNSGGKHFIWKDTVTSGTPERFRLIAAGGVLLPSLTSDPGTPSNGQIWYNSTAAQFKFYQNSASATMLTNPMTALGDSLYGGTAGAVTVLAGNITTTRKFLRQTGNGTVSAAQAWDTVTATDVGLGSVENTALSNWAGSVNITTLGTIGTGTWHGSLITGTYGGTGINNGASTITIGGNLAFSGAYATTITVTGTTTVTLPTSGTLVNTALTLTGGTGINTIGDLSANRTISVDQSFGPTWTGLHTFNPGTTPSNAVYLSIAAPGVAGTRNSHNFLQRGASFDTVAHTTDWQKYVAITSNAGASTLHIQSRIDAGAFADRLTIDDGGNLVVPGNLTVSGTTTTISSTTLTVADKVVQVNYGSTDAGAAGAGLDVLGTSNAILASIHYNSSATSKFTLGTSGTQIEITDISSTQTLSNKTFSGGAKLAGATSGTITIQAAAVAGTNTLTIPAVTGTAVTSADAPASIKSYYSPVVSDTVSLNAWTSDFSQGNVHYIALANATNTATLSNPTGGARYCLMLKSGGASSAVTWPAAVKWPGGVAPTLSTTLGKIDVITVVYDSVNSVYYCGATLNY